MASLSTKPLYICQRCIHNLSHSSQIRRNSHIARQRLSSSSDSPERPAFRLGKHLAYDTKVRGGTKSETQNEALKLSSSNGNRLRRSRFRVPASTPLRKHTATIPPKILVPSEPSPLLWAREKPTSHAKLHFINLEDSNWYWETLSPTIAQKAQANHFFVKNTSAKFLRSIAFFRAVPDSDVPEVAFVGRSNVGKSSLLNAVLNADTKALLARTSSTPGFTKTMNLYGAGPGNGVNIVQTSSGHDKIVGAGSITIVDMPGYGEGSLSEWGLEIMKYLQGRKQLRRCFVLIDAQHGIKDKDRSLLASLRLGGIPHQIILSKLDKIYLPKAKEIKRYDGKKLSKLKPKGSLNELKLAMDAIRNEIQPPVGGGALGELLGCSSEVLVDGKRLGIDAVRFAMLQAIGFPFSEHREKKKVVIRTMKTNAPEVERKLSLEREE